MRNRLTRWFTVTVIVIAAFLWPATVLAVEPKGTGPDDAMISADWMPVGAGEQHWFAFNYFEGKEQVKIQLFAKPENGATFKVVTPAQADQWRRTGEIQWVGAGAKNEAVKSELFWTGEFNKIGTYYVIVEHSRDTNATAWCKLSITGKGVSFPIAPTAPSVVQANVPAPVMGNMGETTGNMVGDMMGSGPALAFTPGTWEHFGEGDVHWFAFDFDRDAANPQIYIDLYLKHTQGITFKVLTPEQAATWQRTGKLEWIGMGSKNSASSADFSWAGSFTTSGTYYVVVEHNKMGGEPAYGMLMVSGGGVTF